MITRTLWLLSCLIAFLAAMPAEEVRITGSGSTFIYPLMGSWMKQYRSSHPEIKFWYEPIGSGRGARQALAGIVDFGASDGPVGDAALHGAAVQVIQIPVTLGAVVPAYNVPGVSAEIRFTGTALAEIYLGKIGKWNDPQIARVNPQVALPNHDIDVLFRLDDSGTTYVWTDYLSKINSEWNKRVGRGTHVSFPIGLGANFNEGIVGLIKQRPYSLGYLQLTYAIENHVPYGRVQNAAGTFVKAESASITAASAATASDMPDDFRVSITNAADADAFPISSFTWLLVPERIADPAKKKAIIGFLRWILSEGQDMATPLHYAPLPADVARKVQHAIDRIQ